MSTIALVFVAFLSVTTLTYRRMWLRSVEREETWGRIIDREVWAKVAAMAAGATAHPGTGQPKGSAGDCSSGADNPEALEVGNDSPACGSREARRQISVTPVDGEGRLIRGQELRRVEPEGDER